MELSFFYTGHFSGNITWNIKRLGLLWVFIVSIPTQPTAGAGNWKTQTHIRTTSPRPIGCRCRNALLLPAFKPPLPPQSHHPKNTPKLENDMRYIPKLFFGFIWEVHYYETHGRPVPRGLEDFQDCTTCVRAWTKANAVKKATKGKRVANVTVSRFEV